MRVYHEKSTNELTYLKPLLDIAKMFGLSPNFAKTGKYLYRMYAMAVAVTVSTMTIMYTSKRNDDDRQLANVNSTNLLHWVINLLMVTINTGTIVSIIFRNHRQYEDFLSGFIEFDHKLHEHRREKSIRKFFVVEMIGIFSLLFSSFVYDVIVAMEVNGTVNYGSFVIDSVNEFMITVSVLVIYNLIVVTRERFCIVNRNLDALLMVKGGCVRKIKCFSRCFLNLCVAVERLNDLVGVRLLGIILLTAFEIIQSVHIILNVLTTYQDNWNFVTLLVIFQYVYTSLLFLTFGVMLASTCERAVKSADDTARICHKLLQECRIGKTLNSTEQVLHEELVRLAYQVVQRKPKFTAADFFTVDYNMLYAMFGSIVSYIVIIIQLK